MNVHDALRNVTTLGIETAPFIYFIEQNPAYVDRVRAVFNYVLENSIQIVTSAITLTEVLVLPIRAGYHQYVQEYRQMLLDTAHVTTLPVSVEIAEQGARLRAQYNLRTPDALHLATALAAGCNAFLTNDRALARVPAVRVLVLDDLTLA